MNLYALIEDDLQNLRTALTRNNEEEIDRLLPILQRDLLSNSAFKAIGDEQLLAEALRLFSQLMGDALKPQLEGLIQHRVTVRHVHDKLYAVLFEPDIDHLLYTDLDQWTGILDHPVGCLFESDTKRELQEIRLRGNSEIRLQEFFGAYFRYLVATGHEDQVKVVQPIVTIALDGYKYKHQWTVHGLFVINGQGEVHGLKIHPMARTDGKIQCLNDVASEMQSAARHALACVNAKWPSTKLWDYNWAISRTDIPFDGNSIGLALTIGILSQTEGIDVDSYTALTGKVDWTTGKVTTIGQLETKLLAAQELGIRRVFIPRECAEEVKSLQGLVIVPVDSVDEAKQQIQNLDLQVSTPSQAQALIRLRELNILIQNEHIRMGPVTQGIEQIRLDLTDHYSTVTLIVGYGKKGITAHVQGSDTPLKQKVQAACDKVFGAKIDTPAGTEKPERQYITYDVRSPERQQIIQKCLSERTDSRIESVKNCLYRAKIQRGNQIIYVHQYTKGKLVIDGVEPLLNEVDRAIRSMLEIPEGIADEKKTVQKPDSRENAVTSLDLGAKWIGSDEAGKGDYFGPLVSAAVLVDQQQAEVLEGLGVRDSKNLSDNRNRELAVQILKLCGKRAQVVTIPPSRYNALYEEFRKEGKNLNTLLAWAHTRALENILLAFPQEQLTVLVDKFADEKEILGKLLTEARSANLRIVQLPKAEANVAVAAASIIARAQFLRSMEEMSKQYRIDFPKGASDPRIPEIGKLIVARWNRNELAKVAKLHFKTTQKILATT